jgi:hypothetical protein
VSEYQYYEFQAIDRPLKAEEMAELRSRSSRARITSVSFVNDYAWGSFRGDEDAWMEKYFDAFLYVANWGTRIFKLRLPGRFLDVETARLYCVGHCASVREENQKTILSFISEDEEAREWIEAEGQLSSLIALRADIARGDLRTLYLCWLLCAQSGDLADDDVEPPVPPGLAELSASLESLVEFLRVDPDLLGAAATASPPLSMRQPEPAAVRAWLAQLPLAEKDEYLVRFLTANDETLSNELDRRMRREREGDRGAGDVARRRTVAELLRAGEQPAGERERIAAEKAAKETEQRARAAALARKRHLDQLAGKEPGLWEKVERLVATKLPKNYDHATEHLVDLRDLAARKDAAGFRRRIETLRAAHARKPTFISRLDKAGL